MVTNSYYRLLGTRVCVTPDIEAQVVSESREQNDERRPLTRDVYHTGHIQMFYWYHICSLYSSAYTRYKPAFCRAARARHRSRKQRSTAAHAGHFGFLERLRYGNDCRCFCPGLSYSPRVHPRRDQLPSIVLLSPALSVWLIATRTRSQRDAIHADRATKRVNSLAFGC